MTGVEVPRVFEVNPQKWIPANLAIATAILLAGCSGDAGTDPTRSGSGGAESSPTPTASQSQNGGQTSTSPVKTKDLGPIATKSVSKNDPPGDAQTSGEVPSYVEILGASVEGAGADGVKLILRMSGDVPGTMPNERTHMIVAWNLTGSKKATGAGFTAQAGLEGWTVSAAQGSDVVDFPGAFEVDRNLAILTVPWDFIDGARKFEWSAAASWFSSSEDGSSSSSSADNITGGRYR